MAGGGEGFFLKKEKTGRAGKILDIKTAPWYNKMLSYPYEKERRSPRSVRRIPQPGIKHKSRSDKSINYTGRARRQSLRKFVGNNKETAAICRYGEKNVDPLVQN